MTIAAVMTVRNEEALLRSNLVYHHFLGVDHFFVYPDRCEDGTLDSVSDLPFVELLPMSASDSLKLHGRARRRLARMRKRPINFGLRIVANAIHATQEAGRRGFDWLLHIDADELVSIDAHNPVPGQLRDYLERIDPAVEVVRFRPFEICQHRLGYENVFAEETLFMSPEGEGCPTVDRTIGRLSRIGRRAFGSVATLDSLLECLHGLYGRVRGASKTRSLFDPFRQHVVQVPWFFGHLRGKAVARLSADVIPSSCHDFARRDGQKPREAVTDYLLHYFAYSFENFLGRTRIRAQFSPPSPLVAVAKYLFIQIVNQTGWTTEELRDYYQRWVLFKAEEIERLQRSGGADRRTRPRLVEITGPKETFALLSHRAGVGSRSLHPTFAAA